MNAYEYGQLHKNAFWRPALELGKAGLRWYNNSALMRGLTSAMRPVRATGYGVARSLPQSVRPYAYEFINRATRFGKFAPQHSKLPFLNTFSGGAAMLAADTFVPGANYVTTPLMYFAMPKFSLLTDALPRALSSGADEAVDVGRTMAQQPRYNTINYGGRQIPLPNNVNQYGNRQMSYNAQPYNWMRNSAGSMFKASPFR